MSSIVRGLLQSVTWSKHSIAPPKSLFHNTHNHDKMAFEGLEDLNATVEDGKKHFNDCINGPIPPVATGIAVQW